MSLYDASHSETLRVLGGLTDLIREYHRKVDLTLDNLTPAKCDDVLGRMGYEINDVDTGGWDLNFWFDYTHKLPEMPNITMAGCGFTAELEIYFTDYIDTDKEAPQGCWDTLKEKISQILKR